jgi:hypothetical protein
MHINNKREKHSENRQETANQMQTKGEFLKCFAPFSAEWLSKDMTCANDINPALDWSTKLPMSMSFEHEGFPLRTTHRWTRNYEGCDLQKERCA